MLSKPNCFNSYHSHLIDVAENDLLNRVVLENLTDNSAVTTTNYENLFRVWMASERQVRDHLLIPFDKNSV